MRCELARQKLFYLKHDELSGVEREELHDHLKQCGTCEEEKALLGGILDSFSATEQVEVQALAPVVEKVRKNLRELIGNAEPEKSSDTFLRFRKAVTGHIKLSLAAASSEGEAKPALGVLNLNEKYYAVFFTKGKSVLHFDFMETRTRSLTLALDGSQVVLDGVKSPITVKNGSAQVSVVDLLDATGMVLRLPTGEEIKVRV